MRILHVVGLMLSMILASGSLRAHFVWVSLETKDGNDPQAHVYFGESAEPDLAKFLDRLTRLKVWYRNAESQYAPLKLRRVETGDQGFLTSALPSDGDSIEAYCLYGVFSHGDKAMLLHYYAKSLRWGVGDRVRRSEKLDLDVSPQLKNGELLLSVSWKGKPIEGSQVIVVPPKGEPSELKTDAEGITALRAAARPLRDSGPADRVRRSEKLDLDVSPQLKNGELLLSVSWKGKPIISVLAIPRWSGYSDPRLGCKRALFSNPASLLRRSRRPLPASSQRTACG